MHHSPQELIDAIIQFMAPQIADMSSRDGIMDMFRRLRFIAYNITGQLISSAEALQRYSRLVAGHLTQSLAYRVSVPVL